MKIFFLIFALFTCSVSASGLAAEGSGCYRPIITKLIATLFILSSANMVCDVVTWANTDPNNAPASGWQSLSTAASIASLIGSGGVLISKLISRGVQS